MKPSKSTYNPIQTKTGIEQFSIVDVAIYEVFNSDLYDGVWFSEISHRHKFVISECFKVLLGYEANHNLSWNAILHPDDLNKFQKYLSTIDGKEEIAINKDIRLIQKSGAILWMQCHIYFKPNTQNALQYIFIAFKNSPPKTKTEVQLQRNSDQLFRQTFAHAPVGMAILDLNGNISEVNKILCECLGYTEEELVHNTFANFSHPEDIEKSADLNNQLMQDKGQNFKLYKRYIHKNGSTIWTQISVSSVKNDERVTTHYVVQIQDITERKENELLLINYQDLLDRSNNVAKIGSWEFNTNDQSVTWSKSVLEILKTKTNSAPNFNEFIEFFTRQTAQRKILKSSFNKALNEGINFDIEILVKINRKKQKWIRLIGISEFVEGHCQRLYGFVQDIDEIKKAQLSISIKEEQWRTTFNHAKAGMAIINFNGKADNVNKSICDIFGYSMKEMLNIGIRDISLCEDIEENIKLMENLINGRSENFTDDLRFQHKKGHIIWANVSVSVVKNDDNQFTHMVAQVIDITESKTNQLLLKKYKDSLEHSNSVAKIASWEIDPETKTLFWSDNLGILLGNTSYKPRVFDDTVKKYVLKENYEHLTTLINDAIEKGVNFDIEIQVKTALGTRWMRMIGISDFENGSCKVLHGLIQDIDDFKSVEQEILLREEEFKQSFWQAPIGMALLDLNGKVTKVNPAICETFGYTKEEMIKAGISSFSHPNDTETSNHLFTQILNGERDSFQQEKRYFHKNGNLIWATLSISGVKNDKGELALLVAQIDDITDIKLLAESLQEHNNRLQNYAHIVSHNLRSHTSNLSMMLELTELNNNGCNSDLFTYIKLASDNMNATVQQLSEIVEINKLLVETLLPQNLKASVDKSIENVQTALNEIHAELSVSVDAEYMVFAVPSYLDSIIGNLLTNAIKFRSPSRHLKIAIKANKRNGHTYLSISDNGLGIDLEKNSDKIFGLYKTFHVHTNARGIGLFIIKNQIEAMGGRIEVKSTPNKGSTFTIYFKDEKN